MSVGGFWNNLTSDIYPPDREWPRGGHVIVDTLILTYAIELRGSLPLGPMIVMTNNFIKFMKESKIL